MKFTDSAVTGFRANVASVNELARFDRLILEIAIDGLEKVADSLLNEHRLYNASRIPHNRALALRNVHQTDSLKRHYDVMFNQCVVLLVSYFGSAMHDLFRDTVKQALIQGHDVPATRAEIKISWSVLGAGADGADVFAEQLVEQGQISFQDMQSIVRAFNTHFGIALQRTSATNDIILGQAARHAIVHNMALVDTRMLKQIQAAIPRTLKSQLTPNETRLHARGDCGSR
ncbi:MAG TPA: hypothetical protein VM733_03465 [Thermoanaerobaculia bacterium]|nr:hypothetical protein [Thermoanaerobaculia bacterium]